MLYTITFLTKLNNENIVRIVPFNKYENLLKNLIMK